MYLFYECSEVAKAVSRIIALALDLEVDFFDRQEMLGKPIAILRIRMLNLRNGNLAFIVNLGDMLERWSNCIFRSTLHRVLGNGQERYSIAYFVEPSHDCVVECLPTCQSQENPPKYELNIDKLFIPVSDLSMNMN
ncbi:hypothetical protein HYC85_026045 [Camellia sinensis]|uniref:Isopenicillin N synthase-like Fe(2+) 2OG dioxygenase domain-containing protein n=1 Tax=Camellia sinensis TaxID=4442 RepID=A0A7J7G6H2_CAMSI|nr:hypothetical protein HYC85_026045 [Camellia sinensis]